MLDRNYLEFPQVVTVNFDLQPAYAIWDTINDISVTKNMSGMSPWLNQVFESMSDQQKHHQRILFDLPYGILNNAPPGDWYEFPELLETLNAMSPYEICERLMNSLRLDHELWCKADQVFPPAPDASVLLEDVETFVNWCNTLKYDWVLDETILRDAHALLNQPVKMKQLMISHCDSVWKEFVEPEWNRKLPMLKESADAFSQMNFQNMTIYEAIREVTGRDMRSAFGTALLTMEHVIFVPSFSNGPYLCHYSTGTTTRLIFGARLPMIFSASSPNGFAAGSSALSRSELLVRLSAMADDTRLTILEMLAQEGELCAQDIIARLDLSQSSVSRHLSQLSATGFIVERRRDTNKCYSLNTERLDDTMRAMQRLLRRKPQLAKV